MIQHKFLYIYILECSDSSYYVGVTNNLKRRFAEHCEGREKGSYTYRHRPVKLVYSEAFSDFNAALDYETRLKKWSRKKKEALIKGEFHLLPQLSKKDFSRRKNTKITNVSPSRGSDTPVSERRIED